MFATFFSLTLFLSFVLQGVFADFSINTPKLVQCQDAEIIWQQTKGPYNVIVVPGDDICGDPIANLGDHSSNHMKWLNVPLVAGRQVVISVEDPAGDEAWTGNITVLPSSDTSCLPQNDRANASASDAAAQGVTTTLVVPPSSSSAPPQAAGAANAGYNPLHSSGVSVRQINAPALWILAALGLLSLSL